MSRNPDLHQKGLYAGRIMDHMGLADLNREISDLRTDTRVPARRLGQQLKQRRDFLREQVRDYVEQQFMLNADVSGKRLREEMLRSVKLSNVEHRNFRLIQEMVYKMAKKLSTLHSRRRKIFKRGQLNVPKTLRNNMSYDGAIFDLYWKSVKIDRPKVFAICDVSGSVANYARFMLMFLYSMDEVMPKVRSFAFLPTLPRSLSCSIATSWKTPSRKPCTTTAVAPPTTGRPCWILRNSAGRRR